MVKENFQRSLELVLKHEGGYVNHPADPGGATNQGVIQRVYDSYRRSRNLMPRSVKFLENKERDEIYKELYWDKIQGDKLPLGVDYCVFDGAVNSGHVQSAKWLQRALRKLHPQPNRIVVDGVVGPLTVDFCGDVDATKLIDDMLDQRLGFMKVIRHRKTGALLFDTFGKGWTRRINDVRRDAKAMVKMPIGGPAKPVPKPPLPMPVPPAKSDPKAIWWAIGLLILAVIAAILGS